MERPGRNRSDVPNLFENGKFRSNVVIYFLLRFSPERMSTSLNLLDTLWFTLHQGDRDNHKDSMDEDENVKVVRLPPTVAQESALVCWTLLEHLG